MRAISPQTRMNTGFLLFALHLPERRMFKELQANHSIVSAEVYQYEKDIVVLINGKYWLYEYADE